MPMTFARKYISEFCRIATRNGIIVFQLPNSQPSKFRTRLFHLLMPLALHMMPTALVRAYRRLKYKNASEGVINALPRNVMEMHGLCRRDVVALLRSGGAEVVRVRQNTEVGEAWVNWQYYAIKR
jgi:CRISPR/Cas system endoribonuclease Cas6 (RAMP superfamily)